VYIAQVVRISQLYSFYQAARPT